MLRIDIRTLEIGSHEFNLEPSPDELGLEPDKMEEIRVDAKLNYDGKEAVVHIDASAVAHLVCDRTMVPFKQPIRGSYTVLFSPNKIDEETDGEVRSFSAKDEELDITDIVRDSLLLAIPIRKIAPGAKDADITTSFGPPVEQNDIDPRWQALAALKEKTGGTELPDHD
jgi:uncharacterized protein